MQYKIELFKIRKSENKKPQKEAKNFCEKYKSFLKKNNIYCVTVANKKLCLFDLIEWRVLWDIHDKILELDYEKKSSTVILKLIKKYFEPIIIFFLNIKIGYEKKKFYRGFSRNMFSKKQNKRIKKADILGIGNSSRTIARLEKILPSLKRNNLKIHTLLDQRVLFPLPSNKNHSSSYISNWYPVTNKTQTAIEQWASKLYKFKALSFREKVLASVCSQTIKATASYLFNLALCAAKIYKTIRPKIILNFEDTELNRVFNFIAKSNKVPSVGVFFLSGIGRSKLITRSFSKLFAAGQSIANSLAWQYKNSTVIVGDPCAVREIGSLNPIKSILFIATFPNYDQSHNKISLALKRTKYLAEQNNLKLGLKGHPLGSERYLNELADKFSIQSENRFHQEDLLEVAKNFDCFSACISSAIFPLMAIGKPIICCLESKIIRNYYLIGFDIHKKSGVTILNKTNNQNNRIFISQVLNLKARRQNKQKLLRFSKHHIKYTGDVAAEKLLKNIKKIIKK